VSGGTTIEAPKAPSGVMGYGEGCALPSQLGDLGERRELAQRGPGWPLSHFLPRAGEMDGRQSQRTDRVLIQPRVAFSSLCSTLVG